MKVSLVLADFLLVALTWLWRQHAPSGMNGWEAVICVVNLGFAAWLGCLAAWVHRRWG